MGTESIYGVSLPLCVARCQSAMDRCSGVRRCNRIRGSRCIAGAGPWPDNASIEMPIMRKATWRSRDTYLRHPLVSVSLVRGTCVKIFAACTHQCISLHRVDLISVIFIERVASHQQDARQFDCSSVILSFYFGPPREGASQNLTHRR